MEPRNRVCANNPTDNHRNKKNLFRDSHFTFLIAGMPIYQIVLHFRKFGCVEVNAAHNMAEYKTRCSTSTLIFSERGILLLWLMRQTLRQHPTNTHEDKPNSSCGNRGKCVRSMACAVRVCVWVDSKSALSTFKTKLLHFWPPHTTMKACGGRMSGGGDADIKHHNTLHILLRFQFT